VKLLAISDLHLGHAANRAALRELGDYPDDWLILAGDVGERPEHLAFALDHLVPRFGQIFWTPGNHDLWTTPESPDSLSVVTTAPTRGEARYQELVSICRRRGVLTPEDPFAEWPDEPGTFIVPMFLLYDYTFRPAEVPPERAVAWARETGVVCSDEHLLDPSPWPSRIAWCHARCEATAARLEQLPSGARTVLVNHWPLRYDLARPPRIPRFSIWSGTALTEDWGRRFSARAAISGHLHLRTTLWRHGVRYDEVSLGYPRDWHADRGMAWYLREILPGVSPESQRFTPPRDPFK
jgi:3',5'-cyclic AMP phosphodiesterase CpdA